MEKKSLFIIGGVIVGILVLLIGFIWITTRLNPVKYSYEELEEKIVAATEKYYHKNPDNLPNESVTLDYSTLVSAGLIKPLSDVLEGGNACSAHVIVLKSGNDYTYIPYLDCQDKYKTKELYKQIIDNNEVVLSGSGLYYNNTQDEYYFRGKVNNNYVSFGKNIVRDKETEILWRIISIKDGVVKLRADKKIKTKTKFDDRFNEGKQQSDGYNNFDESILNEYLNVLKNGDPTLEDDGKPLLTDIELAKLVPSKICVGSRKMSDESKDGSAECAKLSENEYYFTVLAPYEYMRISLDENCKTITNESCSNFNYLSKMEQSDEWSAIPFDENDYQVYVFNGDNYKLEKASNTNSVVPVISLNKYAFFKSGTGAIDDPYIIK